MSRSLSGSLTSALAAQLTKPGYLVFIGWTGNNKYLCSRGDTTWNGNTYIGFGVIPNGLEWRGSAEQTGTLRINNSAGEYSVMALADGVADVPIKVWIFDASAVALGDPVQVFDGVGDSCDIGPESITIKVTSKRSRALFAPRAYINQASGWSIVPPDGRSIEWGGERYVFTRKR